MAEIQEKGGRDKGGGKPKPKKMSTHIDMTPMVDLAFLLLTFFMLTTTFAKPKAMEIVVPAPPAPNDKPTELKESRVLNLILDDGLDVYWYHGLHQPSRDMVKELEQTDFTAEGLRQVLREYQSEIPKQTGGDSMFVLIKPTKTASYEAVVNALDEMEIEDIVIYALMEPTKDELELLETTKNGQ